MVCGRLRCVGLDFANTPMRWRSPHGFSGPNEPREPQSGGRTPASDAESRRRAAFLEQEVELLRSKAAESPRHMRLLEDRLAEAQARVAALNDRNDRLAQTLREARDQMVTLKEEIDRLAQPPSGYGVFLEAFEDGTVDIFTSGRKLRVAVSPEVRVEDLRHGQEVMLNEAMNVVAARGFERAGEVVMLKEILEGGDRALVVGHTDEERVVHLADMLRGRAAARRRLAAARDAARPTRTSGCRRARSRNSSSKRSRTSTTPTSAASTSQIEAIRDAVELPFLHADLFREHQLRPPKGILLYGPPGCGKTLIAKAVANSLAKQVQRVHGGDERATAFFLNIKGPELLNKYVGETERHIRLVFQRAREKASATARRSSCSSTRWTRSSAPAARVCPPTSRTRSSRSCCPRSTASRASRTSSSSARPTART